MGRNEMIPVQIDAEKLCKHTLRITGNLNNFPKKYRFTLVDRVVSITFDVHDLICDANNTFDLESRENYISRAVSSCRKLKFYIRMCYEILNPKCSVEYWDQMVSGIERQLLNWKIATKKRK